jgi:hypothetical protein
MNAPSEMMTANSKAKLQSAAEKRIARRLRLLEANPRCARTVRGIASTTFTELDGAPPTESLTPQEMIEGLVVKDVEFLAEVLRFLLSLEKRLTRIQRDVSALARNKRTARLKNDGSPLSRPAARDLTPSG